MQKWIMMCLGMMKYPREKPEVSLICFWEIGTRIPSTPQKIKIMLLLKF